MKTEPVVRTCRSTPQQALDGYRLFLLGALALFLNSPFARASEDQPQLMLARDFQRLGGKSATEQRVILVAVTREGCSYCARLKREVLVPMIRSGEYDDRLLIRELIMDPESDLIDFTGRRAASAEIAATYSVKITPTVLLLNPAGELLHSPITGINTAEMYGFYLDRAIDQAHAGLGKRRSPGQAEE